jgi:simple sugar transport system permease protein
METIISGIIATAVASGTVIVLAALGEVLAERVGVLNLGLEGIMAMGAVAAIITVNQVIPNPYIGLLVVILVGLSLGALFATATVIFKANQVLAGLALSLFGTGIAGWVGAPFAGQPAQARFEKIPIPFLSEIPILGKGIFTHNLLTYIAYLILPILITYIIYRTKHGLSIQAAGENPIAADTSGINVNQLRFLYSCLGGALAAISGAYLTLAFTPAWSEGVTGGRGWIAIALVIFAGWRPGLIVLGALLFGGVTSLGFVAQTQNWGIPASFLSMLPYLSTMILMIIPIFFRPGELRRISTSPDALGIPYSREGN